MLVFGATAAYASAAHSDASSASSACAANAGCAIDDDRRLELPDDPTAGSASTASVPCTDDRFGALVLVLGATAAYASAAHSDASSASSFCDVYGFAIDEECRFEPLEKSMGNTISSTLISILSTESNLEMVFATVCHDSVLSVFSNNFL